MEIKAGQYVKITRDFPYRRSPHWSAIITRRGIKKGDIYKIHCVDGHGTAFITLGTTNGHWFNKCDYILVPEPSFTLPSLPITSIIGLTCTGLVTMNPSIINDSLVRQVAAVCLSALMALVVGNAGLLTLKQVGYAFAQWGDRRRRHNAETMDRNEKERWARHERAIAAEAAATATLTAKAELQRLKNEERAGLQEGRIMQTIQAALTQASASPNIDTTRWARAKRVKFVVDHPRGNTQVYNIGTSGRRAAANGDIVRVIPLNENDISNRQFRYRIGDDTYWGYMSEAMIVEMFTEA